ncbi:MAG: hypothetical protein VR78_04655 [Hoeflea sp. BRH_c9]|nr:MAG: hypothetical protein VR78_04655 [Hoeflea sp. BRH_c9]
MTSTLPIASLVSAYAGAKARQIKRDVMLLCFVGVMAMLACAALLGAFAVFIAETHGGVIGLLSAAGLALLLCGLAVAIRSVLRRRALRRQRIAATSTASAFAISTVATMVARNKTTAIIAGLAIGFAAGVLARSNKN